MPNSSNAFPQRWQDYSFEFKGFFAYHLAMIALSIIGLPSVSLEIAVAAGVLVVVTAVSLWRRMQLNWHRPPIKALDLVKASGGVLVAVIMIYAGLPLFPPSNPHITPWYLALLGITLFNLLQSLNLVTFSEAAFRTFTIDASANPAVDGEPRWHRVVRGLYNSAFVVVWLTFMAFFYLNSVAIRDGSPSPTPSQTEELSNHGKVVYVSKQQATTVHWFEVAGMTGMPAIILTGFALHLLVGVRIFTNGVYIFGKRYD